MGQFLKFLSFERNASLECSARVYFLLEGSTRFVRGSDPSVLQGRSSTRSIPKCFFPRFRSHHAAKAASLKNRVPGSWATEIVLLFAFSLVASQDIEVKFYNRRAVTNDAESAMRVMKSPRPFFGPGFFIDCLMHITVGIDPMLIGR